MIVYAAVPLGCWYGRVAAPRLLLVDAYLNIFVSGSPGHRPYIIETFVEFSYVYTSKYISGFKRALSWCVVPACHGKAFLLS